MPPPVSGYVAWWDASQITGVSDGSLLSSWPDLSGNGNTLTRTVSAQPTFYNTTAAKLINSLPAVWFAGSQLMSTSAVLIAAIPWTVCMVAQPAATVSGNSGLGGGNHLQGLLSDPSDSPENWIGVNVGGRNGIWSVVGNNTLVFSDYLPATPHVVCLAVTGTNNAVFYVDGIARSALNLGSGGLSTGVTIGDDGQGHFLTGPICEGIIWPSALSFRDVTTVTYSLMEKWAPWILPIYSNPGGSPHLALHIRG